MVFRNAESNYYQHRIGTTDPVEFSALQTHWSSTLQDQFRREFWAENKQAFSVEFRKDVDSILQISA